MARHFEHKLAGFLVQEELEHLTRIREGRGRPFVVIVGGVKIKDKLGALRHLIDKADRVLVGGCVAYTFLASKGHLCGGFACGTRIDQLGSRSIIPIWT